MSPFLKDSYGIWGGPNELLERYWQECVLVEAAQSDRLTEAERIIEAETKIDFVDWLFGYVAASFYDAYERVESQWRQYAGVRSLRDFKENRIKGRNPLTGFGYVGDHGHYPGTRRTFRPEASLFIDTYGSAHEITRQAIINMEDDQILNDDPRDMGEAAADFLARAIISLITSNPVAPDGNPFYSVTRGNQTTDALDENSFVAAWTFMQTQTDDIGRPIRVNPRHVIVQNKTMGFQVDRIINSQLTGSTINDPAGSDFDKGTRNPIANAGVPADFALEEAYLPDANDWYFMADPNRQAAFVVGLLRGQEEPALLRENPQVRAVTGGAPDPYPIDFDVARFKSRWDLGTAAVEPRFSYRGVVP